MSVTSSGRSSTSSTMRWTSGLLRSIAWAIVFMTVVLPALGGDTISPRWPFPIGAIRSMIRHVMSPGCVRRSRGGSRSSGNSGVRSSKRGRSRACSGSMPLTSSMRSSAGFFSWRPAGRLAPVEVVALAQPELPALLDRHVDVVAAGQEALDPQEAVALVAEVEHAARPRPARPRTGRRSSCCSPPRPSRSRPRRRRRRRLPPSPSSAGLLLAALLVVAWPPWLVVRLVVLARPGSGGADLGRPGCSGRPPAGCRACWLPACWLPAWRPPRRRADAPRRSVAGASLLVVVIGVGSGCVSPHRVVVPSRRPSRVGVVGRRRSTPRRRCSAVGRSVRSTTPLPLVAGAARRTVTPVSSRIRSTMSDFLARDGGLAAQRLRDGGELGAVLALEGRTFEDSLGRHFLLGS